ncbi:hypothetical protein [Ureibacillus thermosphaericus]|uniref:Uncharacterized protein n=1 Tax=Ureibacillus thermosphaericus TaxID=51173 RepID=A0A840Q0H1_URETH|nr:hypothetical protein [Ureibacillus thermosphaericus]MBB5150362.1 hypothetical protein [Ureibacillus thermosphaericus]NKZ32948.1 hypothetical protein [Ureibacillus thermosphaericus]
MKKTPLVVWNNFDKEIDEIGAISSSFLAPKIMEWAELDSPSYYSFLSNFSKLLPGYTSVVKLSGEGDLFTETPKELSEKEYIYQLIQYDLLFGKQYSKDVILNESTSHHLSSNYH